MRRAAWIFFASILLPSLVLAWLAMRSVRDQQVVLEHQQAIIYQNITDTLAKNIQGQMDVMRAEFVKTTGQLLDAKASPQILAQNFNRTLREAWPPAEIGFAVNLNGQIYSPTPYDGPEARTFRDENDRFLSNRENVEVYASSSSVVSQNGAVMQSSLAQNAASQFAQKLQEQVTPPAAEKKEAQAPADLEGRLKSVDALSSGMKDTEKQRNDKPVPPAGPTMQPGSDHDAVSKPTGTGMASEAAATQVDSGADQALRTPAPAATSAPTHSEERVLDKALADARLSRSSAASAPVAAAAALPSAPEATTDGQATQTKSVPAVKTATTVTTSPSTSAPVAPAELPISPTMQELDDSKSDSKAKQQSAVTLNSAETKQASPPPGASDHHWVANESANSTGGLPATPSSQFFNKIARSVVPQQMVARDAASLSNTVPEESDFRRVMGSETSGELARFLENKMRLLVWLHPSADAPIVFGAQLDHDKLVKVLRDSLMGGLVPSSLGSVVSVADAGFCAAILDDTGHPVALSRPGFSADWKHPFVATEIGEALPHWEAALYLVDPQQFSRAARTLQWSFFLIVILLIVAIVAGGSAIGRDVRREMLLAQQKTDFVSNVSHELKTPLTSIRMFADLLAEKRVPDEERQATYLRIIAAEASRLTRLINNVLDFARLEKGAPHGEHAACDLVETVRDVADTCGPHLEASGVSFQCEIETATLPIRGDRDALAQIILNLISNAEKYGGNEVLVRVRRQEIATGALGCVDVLDRGGGIPARQVKTIFEPFHRLDDSLSSGIPGSGLGLTLARRMARVHGGDVTYSARADGGSCFTLAVPLV